MFSKPYTNACKNIAYLSYLGTGGRQRRQHIPLPRLYLAPSLAPVPPRPRPLPPFAPPPAPRLSPARSNSGARPRETRPLQAGLRRRRVAVFIIQLVCGPDYYAGMSAAGDGRTGTGDAAGQPAGDRVREG